jgi:hypothetical protein
MLSIVKDSSKLLDKTVSSLPNKVYFWGAVGAVVASSAVYLIKPLRNGLTRLLSPIFGRSKSRRIVRKVAKQTPLRRSANSRRSSSRAVSARRRMAHAH